MDEQNELLKRRRPCSILNSEMNMIEPAWFHMWFIPPADGWPKGLVELSDGIYHDGRTISDGTLKLIHKTGNYYPILKYLSSPFDEQPKEDEKDGNI